MKRSDIYILLDNKDFENKVKDSLIRTQNSNKEHGFNICSTKKGIRTTGIEEGDEHHIHLEYRICRKQTIGEFHTHIGEKDAILSSSDILHTLTNETPIICIGTITDEYNGIIRCFDKDDIISEIEKNLNTKITNLPVEECRKLSNKFKSEQIFLESHSIKKIVDCK